MRCNGEGTIGFAGHCDFNSDNLRIGTNAFCYLGKHDLIFLIMTRTHRVTKFYELYLKQFLEHRCCSRPRLWDSRVVCERFLMRDSSP